MPPQSLLLLLLVSLPDCLGDDSTYTDSDNCTNCIFPFLHHFPEPDGLVHRLHTTCTTIDGDSKPWCATEVDSDNKWTKRKYCTASCPGVLPPRMTDVHPGNTVGNCSCGLANTKTVDTYILGGKDAGFGEFPWQVGLLGPRYTSLASQSCGGALVSDRHVVTAAHCIAASRAKPADLKVAIGFTSLAISNKATSFVLDVAAIKQHPGYDVYTLANDIAVLELQRPVDLTAHPNIKPICLPASGAPFTGFLATVSGWGTLEASGGQTAPRPAHLQKVQVEVFADGDCGNATNQLMTSDRICAGVKAGGRDACSGDSGGPLFTSDPANNGAQTLIGVVSGGIGCGEPGKPGFYAEVAHFRDWLDKQMTGSATCRPPPETTTATVSAITPLKECFQPNKIPVLKLVQKIKNVATREICAQRCRELNTCDFYKWKKNQELAGRVCNLIGLGYETKKNWFSGPKSC